MIPRVPRRSSDQLREEAERILALHHPGGEIPIPIEELIEFGVGLVVLPVRGFRERTDVEGALTADLTTILVDERAMERATPRYRFTLAHELGHFILHEPLIRSLTVEDSVSWKLQIQTIDEEQYGWLEWQAHEFAAHLLVPRAPLQREFQSALARARANRIDLRTMSSAAHDSVAQWIARPFQVSGDVISRRLRRERLVEEGEP